jgi:hypothetical protein
VQRVGDDTVNAKAFIAGEYLALSDDSHVLSGKGGLRAAF